MLDLQTAITNQLKGNENSDSNKWSVEAGTDSNTGLKKESWLGDKEPNTQTAPKSESKKEEDTSPDIGGNDISDDIIEKLSASQDSEKNKLFAKLRIAEKKAAEMQKKLEELENSNNNINDIDEDKFNELYQKKLEKEEKLRQERLSFIESKKESLLKDWYTQWDVKSIFEYALKYTSWNIDVATSLYNDLLNNKKATVPMNFTWQQKDKVGIEYPKTMDDFKKWKWAMR